MTRFQTLALVIGIVIIGLLVALILALLLRPGVTVAPTATPLPVTATRDPFAVSDIELTATWVVGQNMTVEAHLAATQTAAADN